MIFATVELFNREGHLVQLNVSGELVPVIFIRLRELIEQNICGVRLVVNGTGWKRGYFTYAFDPPPKVDVRSGQRRPDDGGADSSVLEEIYCHLWRLPKVTES
jgi:hypothetical protein